MVGDVRQSRFNARLVSVGILLAAIARDLLEPVLLAKLLFYLFLLVIVVFG